MTDTPEMPAMVPSAEDRTKPFCPSTRLEDGTIFTDRRYVPFWSAVELQDRAYRDGFTAGVLAERSRQAEQESHNFTNEEFGGEFCDVCGRSCIGHENYIAATSTEAVLAEAEKAARGGDHSECGHGEGYTDGRLDAAAAIAALADHPPAQPVDDGWRSDMEAAPKGEWIWCWSPFSQPCTAISSRINMATPLTPRTGDRFRSRPPLLHRRHPMASDLSPCPFCGSGDIDTNARAPDCRVCAGSAPTVELWNRRVVPISDDGVSRVVAMLREFKQLCDLGDIPTKTPKPGGSSTLHDFQLEAAVVWFFDRLQKAIATYIEGHAWPAAVTASEGEEWLDPSIKDAAHAAVERLEARKGEDVEQWASNLARDLVAAGESEYGDRLRLDVADAIVRDFAEWHQRASKPDGIHFLNGDAGDGRNGDKELMALGERAVSISGNLQRNLAGSSPAPSDDAKPTPDLLRWRGAFKGMPNLDEDPSDDTPTRDELIEEAAFWRREMLAKLEMLMAVHNAVQDGDRRADIRANHMMPILAAFVDANHKQWHAICGNCGEFIRPGGEYVDFGEDFGRVHAACAGGEGPVLCAEILDEAAITAKAVTLLNGLEDG